MVGAGQRPAEATAWGDRPPFRVPASPARFEHCFERRFDSIARFERSVDMNGLSAVRMVGSAQVVPPPIPFRSIRDEACRPSTRSCRSGAGRGQAGRDGKGGAGRDGTGQVIPRPVRADPEVSGAGPEAGVTGAGPAPAPPTDSQGEPVWFKASQLDRGLSWSKVAARIETIEPVQVEPVQADPKRLFESKASHARRVEGAAQAAQEAQREAVEAKREPRLQQVAPQQDLRRQIVGPSSAQQRAQTYQQRLTQRRE